MFIRLVLDVVCDIIYPVIFYQTVRIVSVMEDITNYHLLYQDPPQWEGLFPLSRIQTMSPNLQAHRWRHSLSIFSGRRTNNDNIPYCWAVMEPL